MNDEHYINFVRLFCAATICSTKYYRKYLPVAQMLFNEFIAKYHELFGTVTSNIHNLTHIVEEVEKKGSLPSISTYPFENHLYQIKKQVRSGNHPLPQIINRMTERDSHYTVKPSNTEIFPLLKEPSKQHESMYLRITLDPDFTLRSTFVDRWFMSKDKEIIAMDFANTAGIYGRKMISRLSHLFEDPLTSVCMHVYQTNENLTFQNRKLYPVSCILCKLVVVVMANITVFIPLVHTLPSDTEM